MGTVLGISRQSIDNWLDIYHQHGVSGLERKEFQFNFSFDVKGDEKQLDQEESPYQREHTWQKEQRYF